MKPLTTRRVAQAPVLGDRICQRTQGEHQQHARDLLGDEPRERPRGRVAPVGILEHEQQRLFFCNHPKGTDEQPAEVVGPHRPLEPAHDLVRGQVKGQHVGEQRG